MPAHSEEQHEMNAPHADFVQIKVTDLDTFHYVILSEEQFHFTYLYFALVTNSLGWEDRYTVHRRTLGNPWKRWL